MTLPRAGLDEHLAALEAALPELAATADSEETFRACLSERLHFIASSAGPADFDYVLERIGAMRLLGRSGPSSS